MKRESGSSSLLPLADFKNEDCAICGKEGEKKKRAQNLILCEPNAEEVYGAIMPERLAGLLYSIVVSLLANEYVARRTAMETVTNNVGEIINKLSLHCNRACQANITQETAETVSDAEGSNG